MLTIEMMRDYGADVDQGLERCMNNESFYLRLVGMALADAGFDKLSGCLAAGDWDGAFEAAHALKGVLGNLAITPIYDPMCELTDLLRGRSAVDYAALLSQILDRRAALAALTE